VKRPGLTSRMSGSWLSHWGRTRGQERFRVGMERLRVHGVALPRFHEVSGIHDGQAGGQVARRRQIVGDHDVCCAVGWCLSMGDYVTGIRPADGATAPPEGASVGYPLGPVVGESA